MKNGGDRQDLVGFNQRNRDEWIAVKAKSLPAGTRVLDVGAGQARYRSLFSHCEYRTQDFGSYAGTSEGLLKEKWDYTSLDYACDATAIPVEMNSFDAVLCTEVLEHVPEPIAVLKELGRVLRPNGRLFLSAPLGSGLHQQPYHFYGGFTPHFYHRVLPEMGFKIVSIEPNGRFFRMLLQELSRGVSIIRLHRSYPRWHPAEWFLRAASSYWVAEWFTQLDEEVPIDEFTVGYHVEAIKVSDGS
jgi:ubiquinone/menaquinone biosynthesis C-methylase UbiE